MAAGRPKSIDNSKIFDISKPDKSKPMGTSRPVIISRGNIIKDPTVNSEPSVSPSTRKVISPVTINASSDEVASPKIQVKVNGASKSLEESMTEAPIAPDTSVEVKNTATTIEPDAAENTTDSEPSSAEETPAVEEKPADDSIPAEETSEPEEAAAAEGSEEPAQDSAETAETVASDSETPPTSEAATVDALAESTTFKKEEAKELELRAKRDAEMQALIDSEKYFVPLEHDSTAKKSRTGLWVFILIILLVSAAYVVIDMKLVKTGINLPFHLFKQ